MNLAAILIPPSLDAKQAERLRRFGFAALSYVRATALVALAWMFGVLPASTVLEVAAAFLALNLGLYAVNRRGANLRFQDPSLTRCAPAMPPSAVEWRPGFALSQFFSLSGSGYAVGRES